MTELSDLEDTVEMLTAMAPVIGEEPAREAGDMVTKHKRWLTEAHKRRYRKLWSNQARKTKNRKGRK